MNILFVCDWGQNRSVTAAKLFRDRYNTRSCGVRQNHPSVDDLNWADIIYVMEDHQRTELARRFPGLYLRKDIRVLNIGNIYGNKLIEELKKIDI
ncbi:protein tyrosine phosphatase [Candidatus Woesearchaeota archaeon]|nr:protein tyrosine phosphatase [Candidatus Woesearchaeota archaeon]